MEIRNNVPIDGLKAITQCRITNIRIIRIPNHSSRTTVKASSAESNSPCTQAERSPSPDRKHTTTNLDRPRTKSNLDKNTSTRETAEVEFLKGQYYPTLTQTLIIRKITKKTHITIMTKTVHKVAINSPSSRITLQQIASYRTSERSAVISLHN